MKTDIQKRSQNGFLHVSNKQKNLTMHTNGLETDSRKLMRQILSKQNILPRLNVGSPNDPLEREADDIANKVVSGQTIAGITNISAGSKCLVQQKAENKPDRERINQTVIESRVPNFRPHVPSPIYYQRFAAHQGLKQFERSQGDHEKNRLIELYETLAVQDPETYTGSVYEKILTTSTTARSNIIAAAMYTPTDCISNRTRWALQVSLLAYIIEYGMPNLDTSFVYEWHDFAFRFAGDAPTIGKIPWFILRYVDFPGVFEFFNGKAGREQGSKLIAWTIYAMNQPDGSIPTWALPLRIALDALGSFPEAFYDEQLPMIVNGDMVQRKKAENLSASAERKANQVSPYLLDKTDRTNLVQRAGAGSPLVSSTRHKLESSMRAYLGSVRVHDDTLANELNCALNARAFTFGKHIWLGKGESQKDLCVVCQNSI